MKPYQIKHDRYTSFGRITWRWMGNWPRFASRIGAARRIATARWPMRHWERFIFDEEEHGYTPYPEADSDTWMVLYWRRRKRPAGHRSYRFVQADLAGWKHRTLARRAKHLSMPRFSRWSLRSFERVY